MIMNFKKSYGLHRYFYVVGDLVISPLNAVCNLSYKNYLARETHKKASKNLQNFIGSFVRNVNQPKISSNETFPESSKGSIVAHLGKYLKTLIYGHVRWCF